MSFNLRHFMNKRRLMPIEWAHSNGINSIEDYDKFMERGEFVADSEIRSQLETAFQIEQDMMVSMRKPAPAPTPVVATVKETPTTQTETPAVVADITEETQTTAEESSETAQDKSAKKKRQKPDTDQA